MCFQHKASSIKKLVSQFGVELSTLRTHILVISYLVIKLWPKFLEMSNLFPKQKSAVKHNALLKYEIGLKKN